MHGGHDRLRELVLEDLAAHLHHPERPAEQRLRRGGAEADEHLRFHHCELRLEPGAAGGDLARVRLLVQSPLPARGPLEVLHDVGDVDELAIDARLLQGAVEQLASRADEGAAELVLAVSRLLSDEDRAGRRHPFAEDRLRSRLVQGAGGTPCGGGAELFQRRPLGIERYFDLILRLGKKLSVVLWQLPPQMNKADPERLAQFLGKLPRRGFRHAFEFRSASWYADEVCAVLEGYGAAFCEHDLVALKPPRLTGGFRYLRFQGATGKYRGRYGKRALRPFARDLLRWPGDAYVYFNNDTFGHALRDALDLRDLLGAPIDCGDVVRDPRRGFRPAIRGSLHDAGALDLGEETFGLESECIRRQ